MISCKTDVHWAQTWAGDDWAETKGRMRARAANEAESLNILLLKRTLTCGKSWTWSSWLSLSSLNLNDDVYVSGASAVFTCPRSSARHNLGHLVAPHERGRREVILAYHDLLQHFLMSLRWPCKTSHVSNGTPENHRLLRCCRHRP